MMLHPASLLLAWGGLVLLLQRFPFQWLLPAGLLVILAAWILASPLYLPVLRRARWLFLTLFMLFSTMTPGVFLPAPWNFGVVTVDGLVAAAEHALRLAAILGLVALLLRMLDQRAIVAGLFVLLRPFAACGINRERISVRLLLVLDQIAAGGGSDWRQSLRLPVPPLPSAPIRLHVASIHAGDIALVGIVAIAMVAGWLWL